MEAALAASLTAGWSVLSHGGPALDAVVEAVAAMEDSGLFNAGRGSVPTTAGRLETDAAVMDGRTGAAGGVCAATWPANPVRAALLVSQGAAGGGGEGRFQAILLAGAGADRLAREAGLAPMPAPPPGAGAEGEDGAAAGTVGAVAVDGASHVAAATSTGGRPGQPPGRVGDSPIIGAGTWADNATAAISATGTGEAFVLAGFAHLVDWAARRGSALDDAMAAALAAVSARGGSGGGIAIGTSGQFSLLWDTPAMARGWRDGGALVTLV